MTRTVPGLLPPRRRRARAGLSLGVAALLAGATVTRAEAPSPTPTPAPAPAEQALPHGSATAIVVTAPRMDIPLQENPAATTVIEGEALATLPRTIGADEALRLVPGVKVDNQADEERVHLSIRGQGILTERGIRGIKVVLDGLPLNDPTGFAPDLFDVDWATVRRIEVFRGPASALFGGGASGGILNIETRDGGPDPVEGRVSASAGSHGFWKTLAEAGGTDGAMNYRVSASRMTEDGYRVHTAARATNLYGKFNFDLGPGNRLTAIVAGTDFFNQNAEGLNLEQVRQDPRQANPDALTYDEFQRTRRATVGVTGTLALTARSELAFAAYSRFTRWTESVPSSVDHRDYQSPGGFLQYRTRTPIGPAANDLTIGADLDGQRFGEIQRPNLGDAREGTTVLTDQVVHQRGVGVYLLDRLELSRAWSVMAGVRHDSISNTLADNLATPELDLSGRKSFAKTTGRIGVAWNPTPAFGAYISWAQGFLPPATEELANNPDRFGGFNEHLVPATSHGEEVGARGSLAGQLTYDVAVFRLLTANDFGRYRVESRPLETFYDNAGSSRRYGVETAIGFFPSPRLSMELAYTYSRFRYDQVRFDDDAYFDTWLPNSPRHQAALDAEYRVTPELMIGIGADLQSRAYIDPTNTTWIGGYTLVSARVSYRTRLAGTAAEFLLSGRNLGGKRYIAFTEPDADGNSYQPGPGREAYGSVRLHF
ncbi:MAG: TonB-dependent receptor [Thermoanaerobaculaceae bacterium]|nr:TonB-dependent receptor [Thermoanaerobaculaceae bacterium]